MDDDGVCKGLGPASVTFFTDCKKYSDLNKSDDFYECEETKSSNEDNALTCLLVARMFSCRECHAKNPAKQGFFIALQLHVDLEEHCNISDKKEIRINNAALNMNENDDLFNFVGSQFDF